MSEEKAKPVRAEVYKEDVLISLELPVAYVTRFNQLLLEGLPYKDQDHFLEVMKNIGENKIEDAHTYHTQTILAFLTLVEDAARKQNHLHWVEYNPETQEKTPVDGPFQEDQKSSSED